MYKNWINAVLGLIVIGLAFMDLSGTTLAWTLGIIGAALVTNSFWSTIVGSDEKDYRRDVSTQI